MANGGRKRGLRVEPAGGKPGEFSRRKTDEYEKGMNVGGGMYGKVLGMMR